MEQPSGEQIVRHIAEQPDRVRVAIEENSKGEPQVKVRITGNDADVVAAAAEELYQTIRDNLDKKATQEGGA